MTDPLPMAPPSCALDEAALVEQVRRYAVIGGGARVVRDDPERIVLRVARGVADSVIEQTIAVERECCPFFEIDWDATARELAIGVSRTDEAPALDAIRYALRGDAPAG